MNMLKDFWAYSGFEGPEYIAETLEGASEEELKEKSYYALYDLQLNGFKGGFAGETKKEVMELGVERIIELSKGDLEPCPIDIDLPLEDILKNYHYKVIEVTYDEYIQILKDESCFLSEIVDLFDSGVA